MGSIRSLDWQAHLNQPVRIYRNLNNGRMSIQAKVGKSWKVVGHVTDCVLRDVRFKVQEGGRQRVLRDRCKNVHAWGEGILIAEFDRDLFCPIDLSYNPYTDTSFKQRNTNSPIVSCRYLVVRNNSVFVSPDAVKRDVPENGRSVVLPAPSLFRFAFVAA